MMNTVFSAFNFRLASPKNCTSLSNNVMISCEDLANIKISFANLKAGFTHVQLTVAHWLQLGGGVERKVEKPEPANPPDSAATSDYSDRLHLLHRSRRRDHPGRACTSLPSVEERHSAKLSKWTTSFSAQSVEEPVTRAPPRVRQLPAPPGRQTTPTFPDGPRCRNVVPEPRPKTECPTKGTPQRTPLKGQGKAHRGGKGKGKGSSNAASSGNQPVPLPHACKLAPRPFPHTFGYVCLLLSNDECWMQIV